MLIGGEKVNFVIINKRFSQDVHNCVGFAAATLAGDKQAKNPHPRNCKGFFPVWEILCHKFGIFILIELFFIYRQR